MLTPGSRQAEAPRHAYAMGAEQAVRSKRLELKKVLGEENPADLLTKHSLSKDRLAKLVALFACQFKGGRAEAAPQTRTGESSKKTMAQAESEVNNLESGDIDGQYNPQMPHNQMSTDELDQHYPSLEAVEDLDLQICPDWRTTSFMRLV